MPRQPFTSQQQNREFARLLREALDQGNDGDDQSDESIAELTRGVQERAVASDSVSVTVDSDPVMVLDQDSWGTSEFAE